MKKNLLEIARVIIALPVLTLMLATIVWVNSASKKANK